MQKITEIVDEDALFDIFWVKYEGSQLQEDVEQTLGPRFPTEFAKSSPMWTKIICPSRISTAWPYSFLTI